MTQYEESARQFQELNNSSHSLDKPPFIHTRVAEEAPTAEPTSHFEQPASQSDHRSKSSTAPFPNLPPLLADPHTQQQALDFLVSLKPPYSFPSALFDSLIEECLASANFQIKTKAANCILHLAEYKGVHGDIVNSVRKMLGRKESVAAGLYALRLLLMNYGSECFETEEFVGIAAELADSKSIEIRAEAVNYLKEAHRWNKGVVEDAAKTIQSFTQIEMEEMLKESKEQPTAVRSVMSDRFSSTISKEKLEFPEEIPEGSISKELVESLKEVLQGSDVKLAKKALGFIAQLAAAKGDRLSLFAKDLVGSILEKYNSKETITEATNCMNSLIPFLKLEDLVAGIGSVIDRNAMAAICSWLEFSVFPKVTSLELFDKLLQELSADSAEEIKNAALSCIRVIRSKRMHELQKGEKNEQSKDKMESESTESIISKIDSDNNLSKSISISESRVTSSKKTRRKAARLNRSSGKASKLPFTDASIEEDVEAAMPLEASTKVVYENVPPNILAQFDMTEAREQQSGLRNLSEWVKENVEKAQQAMEAVVIWLKRKSKEFREGNTIETLLLIKTFCTVCEIDKKFAREIIPVIIERMGDLKLHKECTQIILLVADSVNPTYVSVAVMRTSCAAKSSNVVKGSLAVLTRMLEEYGPALLPAKATVDYAKHFLPSNNPAVHTAALHYIVLAYKMIGSVAKSWIYTNLKESAAKVIEGELSRVTLQPAAEAGRVLKNETAELQMRHRRAESTETAKADISSQITYKILAGLSNPSVRQRQEAKDAVERILMGCNNSVQGVGLGALVNCLKERMSEPYKKLARAFIALVGNLAEAVGKDFAQHCKAIVQPLMTNLSDKQAAIRSETMTAMDKIAAAVGPEHVLNAVGEVLEKGNFETRNALLIWIVKNCDALGCCDEKALVKPLIAALQDKSKEIRMLSEQVIKRIVSDIGQDAFVSEIQDAKLLASSNLKSLLTKYRMTVKENEKPEATERNIKTNTLNPLEAAISNTVISKSGGILKPRKEQRKTSLKSHRGGLNSSLIGGSLEKQRKLVFNSSTHGSTANLRCVFDRRPKTRLSDFKRVSKKIAGHSRQLSKSSSKNSLNYSSNCSELQSSYKETIVVSTLGNKEKRNELDRSLKWPITEVRKDYLESLKKTLKALLAPSIAELMFSTEVKRNLKVLKLLVEGLKTEFASMLDLFDLFCKWIIVKMIDQPNALLIKKLLEFIEGFFNEMTQANYQLYDFEAAAIIPILCEKLGVSNEVLKSQVKNVLRFSLMLYPAGKVGSCVVWALDATRNKKTKLECLVFVGELVRKCAASEICSLKNVRSLTKYVVSIESSLRNEALELISVLYKGIGNSLWVLMGELPENVKAALSRRLENVGHPEQGTINTSRPLTNRSSDLNASLRNCPWKKPQHAKTGDHMTFRAHAKGKVLDLPFRSGKDISLHASAEERTIVSLENALEVIRRGEIARRVDALMYLNEMAASNLEEEKKCLIAHCDQLLNCFSEVLDEIFDNRPQDIPIRFAKYFMTVVSKICSCKFFVAQVCEQSFTAFAEQLLTKLLYDGLEMLGDCGEGEYLVKVLNSTMLKILEHYDPTKVFVALINLFKCYRNIPPTVNYIRTGRLPGLIVKCMLKMVKGIGSMIDSLDPPRILLALHEYLLLNPSTSLPKSSNDDIGIRISKTIIYELINARGEVIWEDYKLIELHEKPDLHIRRWISLLLKSTHPVANSPVTLRDETLQPLREIFRKLGSEENYERGIEELTEYVGEHSDIDLAPYFATIPEPLQERIRNSLEELQEEAAIAESVSEVKESVIEDPANSGSSLSEYKSKLTLLKQKFAIGTADE